MKIFKWLILGLTFTILLGGCGKKKESDDTQVVKNNPKETKEAIVNFNLGSDPKTLDPQLNAAVDGRNVLVNTFEGLMKSDKDGIPEPAVAESYTLSEDGLHYTFKIKKDIKWSDGTPLTAKDFEYAWKRALNPQTGAENASQIFYIKGAKDYYEGKGKLEDVMVKAVDDTTLEVELIAPTPYFLGITSFSICYPVKKSVVESDPEGWAKNPETVVSNGPFVLTEYKMGDKIVVSKNENYWNAKNVKLDKIVFYTIVDANTALTAFNNNELDILDVIPITEIPKLLKEDDRFQILPYLGTYYYMFQVDKGITSDVNVRKALSYAVDRKALTEQVAKGGEQPASGFVPAGIADSKGDDFREIGGDYGISPTGNIEKAKEYLAKAGYPDGKGFPEISLLFNTSDKHKLVAEAVQSMWKKNLGIDVKLQNQEWAVFQDTRENGNFEIARGGWIGNYVDPMTFLDLFTSYSGNNDVQWKWNKGEKKHPNNKIFDEKVKLAQISSGVERDKLMHEAEDIMMEEAIVMPLYYYTHPIMIQNHIKGWEVDVLGDWYLGNAFIEEAK